ncbi:hypothetical protein, partial [Intestinimonas butyriciproducens]|uniref:hypothetical protein n=1 Tax=Intestinimonas butyriciproducens TaxID=1297617 RepID=UPI001A9A6CE4
LSCPFGLADVRAYGCGGQVIARGNRVCAWPGMPLPEGSYVDDSIMVDTLQWSAMMKPQQGNSSVFEEERG